MIDHSALQPARDRLRAAMIKAQSKMGYPDTGLHPEFEEFGKKLFADTLGPVPEGEPYWSISRIPTIEMLELAAEAWEKV